MKKIEYIVHNFSNSRTSGIWIQKYVKENGEWEIITFTDREIDNSELLYKFLMPEDRRIIRSALATPDKKEIAIHFWNPDNDIH